MAPEVPAVFLQWERFLGWLLDRTQKFPRQVRQTLTLRVENLALDIFEALVEARYGHGRRRALVRVNLDLEKLRLLLRLAHERRHLDPRAFEHACVEIDSVGRQVGGWLRAEPEAR